MAVDMSFAGLSEATGAKYFPHDVTAESGVQPGRGNLQAVELENIGIVKLTWGAAVRVTTDHRSGFAVNIPLRSAMTVRWKGGQLRARTRHAIVCPPDTDVEFPGWASDVVMLGLRIPGDYFRRQLDQAGVEAPVEPKVMDVSSGVGGDLLSVAGSLMSSGGLLKSPAVSRNMSAALVSGMTVVMADQLGGESGAVKDHRVATAIEAIEADPARAWTVADISASAGCSVRTLQAGFRDSLGVTPMDYVRSVRLDVIHEELCAGDVTAGDTVTDIALKWGVSHLGRFAAAYRVRFGCTPRETLSAG